MGVYLCNADWELGIILFGWELFCLVLPLKSAPATQGQSREGERVSAYCKIFYLLYTFLQCCKNHNKINLVFGLLLCYNKSVRSLSDSGLATI